MHPILKTFIFVTITTTSILLAAISGAYIYLLPSLPDASSIDKIQLQIPLRIYSREGLLIGEFGDNRRTPIKRKDIPEKFIQAFLAAEDDRFYEHGGISLKSLSRAVWQMASQSDQQTGGSTITMQVAKNYFLTPDRTIIRKLKEIFLSVQIEKTLTKDEILELYVNKIFLGNRAYGIAAAAQVYFDKSCDELTLPEMAMIAGLPKAPSTDNPVANPERALERRNWVLKRMAKLGYITRDEYLAAKETPVSSKKYLAAIDVDAPYIAEMARAEVVEMFGQEAYSEGLKVTTTVHAKWQEAAQEAIRNGLHAYDTRHGYRGVEAHLEELTPEAKAAFFSGASTAATLQPAIVVEVKEKAVTAELADQTRIEIPWANGLSDAKKHISANRIGFNPKKAADILKVGDVIRIRQKQDGWHLSQIPVVQGALVSLDPKDGAILSLVGGFDFYQNKFNRAIQAKRQIGSTIKPFIYAAALHNGYTPATIINDAPVVFDDPKLETSWRPENDSGNFLGPIRLREALYKSRNLVSVRIVRQLGVRATVDYVSQFGFDRNDFPYDLTLALGSPVFTPMQVATGYASFANGGFKVKPYLISEIRDSEGKVLYRAEPEIACGNCTEAQAKAAPAANTTEAVDARSVEDLAVPATQKPAARIMDPKVAFLIDNILKDVVGPAGTGHKVMELKRSDLAGKTGTTNGPTDAWFAGYHPHVVTTVWMGFNNNSTLGGNEYGGSAAVPIWIEFMKTALAGQPTVQRPIPAGIVTIVIDRDTGRLAQPDAGNTLHEYIQEELLPAFSVQEGSSDTSAESIEEIF